MKHEVEFAEEQEARLMFDRLLERMGDRGTEMQIFHIPYDERTGRLLIHRGNFMIFSSKSQAEHYLRSAQWASGIPIQWHEVDAINLKTTLHERGALNDHAFVINPCAFCGHAQRYAIADAGIPERALGIWISDSASRFAKIAPVLQEVNSVVRNPVSSRRQEILQKIEWLLVHIDPSMPDLLHARAELLGTTT